MVNLLLIQLRVADWPIEASLTVPLVPGTLGMP
jgi:hypothetical protein